MSRSFPEASLEALKGIKTWIVDVYLDAKIDEYEPRQLGPGQGMDRVSQARDDYLTHLNAAADYDTLCHELPPISVRLMTGWRF
jgi:hypothetical protein